MNHFHVVRHGEDDDPFLTANVADALDYAATELEYAADWQHTMISAHGEVGDFEEAYGSFVRSERFTNAMLNARNIVRQHTADSDDDRAPLYRGEGASERLAQATDHVVEYVNAHGPIGFRVWSCDDQTCELTNDAEIEVL